MSICVYHENKKHTTRKQYTHICFFVLAIHGVVFYCCCSWCYIQTKKNKKTTRKSVVNCL